MRPWIGVSSVSSTIHSEVNSADSQNLPAAHTTQFGEESWLMRWVWGRLWKFWPASWVTRGLRREKSLQQPWPMLIPNCHPGGGAELDNDYDGIWVECESCLAWQHASCPSTFEPEQGRVKMFGLPPAGIAAGFQDLNLSRPVKFCVAILWLENGISGIIPFFSHLNMLIEIGILWTVADLHVAKAHRHCNSGIN